MLCNVRVFLEPDRGGADGFVDGDAGLRLIIPPVDNYHIEPMSSHQST
jgi:hypothetical protein